MQIAILGGGSWGTALAVHLAKKHYVKVWEFFEEQAREMQEERKCRLLPEVSLPGNIFVSSLMEEIIPDTELVLLAVPSDKVKSSLEEAKKHLKRQLLVICSKGLGEEGELLTKVVGGMVKNKLFCFYGPTHAEEVCQGKLSGAVLAGKGKKLARIKSVLESEELRVEVSRDLVGVQVGAALKNILAILVGVLDGQGLGDNAKAYVMTKGLEEIKKIGVKMGGKRETFYGLAGLGDVIVTCMSRHSRNRFVGREVGKGRKLEEVTAEMKMVAEGITTVKTAVKLKERLGLELPLISGLYKILFEGEEAGEVLKRI